ncbi:MAG: TolC family protein [Deltaproteobacteria bacterium]|nr:TolC family protein [Deltaproteobacteria bacterium]
MISFALLVLTQVGSSTLAMSLDDVLARADQVAGEVVRAEFEVVSARTDQDRAWAAIRPSVTLSLDAREYFFGNPIREARWEECEPQPACRDDQIPWRDKRWSYGPFRDYRFDEASHPVFALSLGLRQLLFDGGRFWSQILRAGSWKTLRDHLLQAARNNVRLEALRRFYAVARAEAGLAVAEVRLKLAEANRARSEKTGRDLALAERDAAADAVQRARARYQVGVARRALATFIALDPDVPLALNLPRSSSTAMAARGLDGDVKRLVEEALTRRPEILASRANVEYYVNNLDMEQAAHWPTFALTLNYARTSRRPDRVISDPTENYTANAGISMSFGAYAGGDVNARVERAELDVARARRAHEDLERDLRSEVIDRAQRVELLRTVLRLAQVEADAAEAAMELAQSSYAEGRSSAMEERDAEVRWIEARRSVIEARFDLQIGHAELERAVGR